MPRVRVALFALLLVLATGPVAVHATSPAVGSESSPTALDTDRPVVSVPASTQQTQFETPSETFRVQLRPGGNARWTVTANFSFTNESNATAFEELATDFEAGRTDSDLGLSAFRQAADLASSSTGREMSITRVERSYEVYNDTGQLVLQFTWTNFSRRAGDRLHVDDTFNTTGGTWFPDLSADQVLIVDPPDNFQIVDASPQGYAVTSGALRWEGYQEFEDGELSATYRRVGETATITTTKNGTGPPNGDDNVGLLAAIAVILVGAVAAGTYVLSTREGGLPSVGETDEDDGTAGAADEPGDPATAGAPAADEQAEVVDEELLSDEERIERLLEQNGGRMKQATIVKETGWSNAKVSQLLSAMDDEDRIDKLRIGRENLISFPDEDVTDIDTDDS